ncbi:hypothetical protein IMZ48_25805 [Candidatus Bathyarchaeota archaeon]|nr:hypothetical protein [Candidatus Bathyarchaeota archaeon]
MALPGPCKNINIDTLTHRDTETWHRQHSIVLHQDPADLLQPTFTADRGKTPPLSSIIYQEPTAFFRGFPPTGYGTRRASPWGPIQAPKTPAASKSPTPAASKSRGPLDGVPFAVKDDYDIDGYCTCLGSRIDYTSRPSRTRCSRRRERPCVRRKCGRCWQKSSAGSVHETAPAPVVSDAPRAGTTSAARHGRPSTPRPPPASPRRAPPPDPSGSHLHPAAPHPSLARRRPGQPRPLLQPGWQD